VGRDGVVTEWNPTFAYAVLELGVGVDVCWPYPALAYLTEIVHRRPKEWIRDVDQLHELLQQHGPDRLRGAFDDGLQTQVFGAPHVARALRLTRSLLTEGTIQ
jgi:hypothetical protein